MVLRQHLLSAPLIANLRCRKRGFILLSDLPIDYNYTLPVENLLASAVVSAYQNWRRTTSSDQYPPSWLDAYRRQRD